MDQRSGDGRFSGRIDVFAIGRRKELSKLWDAGRKDCFCFQSRAAETPKGGPVSTRKTDRLHDPRLLSGYWRSWHRIGPCWFIQSYSSWWQHSGIRYKMGRSPTTYVKISIRWCLGMSVQIENTWVRATQNRIRIVRHGDSSENVDAQLSKKKKKTMMKRSMDQKLRLRNFDARHGKIETRVVVKSRKGMNGVEGGKGTCYQWKEKGQCSKGDQMQFPT